MMQGGGDIEEEARKRGIPVAFLEEAEGFGDCLVYPDNWPTVMIFRDMSTQWRVGMSGPVGLDYNVLQMIFRLRAVPRDERTEIFDGLQTMESAALEAIAERRK